MTIKRVIMHWTAGGYSVSGLDRSHYHLIIDGDGKTVVGLYKVSDNFTTTGRYAAHTLGLNAGSASVAMACMAGAVEGKTHGRFPMKEIQFDAMCREVAKLCKTYRIAVTRSTVLSHAEVQPTLGVRQRGKWDFTVLPFAPTIKGHRACGDFARARVAQYMR